MIFSEIPYFCMINQRLSRWMESNAFSKSMKFMYKLACHLVTIMNIKKVINCTTCSFVILVIGQSKFKINSRANSLKVISHTMSDRNNIPQSVKDLQILLVAVAKIYNHLPIAVDQKDTHRIKMFLQQSHLLAVHTKQPFLATSLFF